MISEIRQKPAVAPILTREAQVNPSGVDHDGARQIAIVTMNCVEARQLGNTFTTGGRFHYPPPKSPGQLCRFPSPQSR
ncbi:MAG TPA: hypothetical protein VKU87_07350 [Thermomicrobiaceae bacterium]|nr:hypothetical protein [Thermomicrobiaceae bacterium]